MKKAVSCVVFVLVTALFLFETYFGIAGAVELRQRLAELAAREASGHELLGVGADVLALGLIALSLLGWILSFVSFKIAWARWIRWGSGGMGLLFFLPPCVSALIVLC